VREVPGKLALAITPFLLYLIARTAVNP